MRYSKRRKFEKKVISLYLQKVSNVEIAKIVGVTEKTIRTWLKDFKSLEADISAKINALDLRLEKMVENPDTPSEEIKNIVLSIRALEDRLNK